VICEKIDKSKIEVLNEINIVVEILSDIFIGY